MLGCLPLLDEDDRGPVFPTVTVVPRSVLPGSDGKTSVEDRTLMSSQSLTFTGNSSS